MDKKEIAYHEAGHAVIGNLFYQPVEKTTIIPLDGCLGNTFCEIPSPLIFEEFDNDLFFSEYIKIALYCWACEYFQKIINPIIDINGLKIDKEIFDFYLSEQEKIIAFEYFKDSLLKSFFANETIIKMIEDVADELLKKETLIHSDIKLILSKFNYDYDQEIELLMDKYYIPICNYYKELKLNI